MALSPDQEMKRRSICAEFRDLMESRPELSQADVARMLNTTRSTIHKYVNAQATPRPVVMEMFRAKLRKLNRHEHGDPPDEGDESPMQQMERQVIHALRRIEPIGKRSRMALAVREMLLAAGPPVHYRSDGSGSLSEVEKAALDAERDAIAELQRSGRGASGGQREPAAGPPAGGDTTNPEGRRGNSRT